MLQAVSINTTTLPGTEPMTMSSLDIAELTGKRHDNVMRDIREMLETLKEGGVLKFEDTPQNPQNGQRYPVFRLPKRECLILISGYSVDLRARIIDRWMELEAAEQARIAQPSPQPFPLSRLERLVLEHMALVDGHQARKNKVIDHFSTYHPRLQASIAVETLIRLGALVEFRASVGIQGSAPYFIRMTTPEGWLALSRADSDAPYSFLRQAPWPAPVTDNVPLAAQPQRVPCPVLPLTQAAEATLRADGSPEARDAAITSIEELIAQQAPTSLSGALYHVRLMQEAVDLISSWVPSDSKGAKICEAQARMVTRMGDGICDALSAMGGQLPASVQAHHSRPSRA
ncbi:Rha family transcriptional regulator [Roseixanthobacter psychrophilus]|uniref:Rha family transcriptional regulator n=1 Tax=Roseixanthobacter psychrophilus TaxID=3119917 RepID=UPI003D2055FB